MPVPSPTSRPPTGGYPVGQNIFYEWSSGNGGSVWPTAVRMWYEEVQHVPAYLAKNFRYVPAYLAKNFRYVHLTCRRTSPRTSDSEIHAPYVPVHLAKSR